MRPGFRYTSPPLTQGALTLGQIGLAVALLRHPAAADAWGRFTSLPEPVLVVAVPWVLHQLLYWVAVVGFDRVDRTDRPTFIARWRIQSGTPQRPPRGRVLRNLAVNQLFWTPLLLAGVWGLLRARGWAPSPELPGVGRFVLEIAGMGACSVVWFYVSHRALHRPYWMARVHRVHHEFRTTSAIASEYAHWIEFTVGNFGTLACGVVLLAPSLPALYVYTVVAISTVLVHHSGYALPWASWAVHHDWHHFRYSECFGTLGVLDRLLGTDAEFRTLRDGDTR